MPNETRRNGLVFRAAEPVKTCDLRSVWLYSGDIFRGGFALRGSYGKSPAKRNECSTSMKIDEKFTVRYTEYRE